MRFATIVFLAAGISGMIPAILEKFGYVATLAMLRWQGRIAWVDAQSAIPDGLLGLLFILAFVRTRDLHLSR